jgi:addiction module RelB/DinJ family antitoxin
MKTILNVKVDSEEKEKAKQIAMEMGVPLSTIINAQLREFIRTREFSVKLEPRLKPAVEKELLKMSKEYHSGKCEKIKFVKSVEKARKILSSK